MKCQAPVEATRGGSSSVGATWGTEATSWGTEATWGAPSAEDVVSSPWAVSSSDTVEFPLASSYFPPSGEERGKTYNHYNDFFAACEKHQKEMMKVESSRDCQARKS